ncbi:MAG TPA: kelch repeat-containing protein, partial [Candidatus Eisenbacteria bacterium]|nr:kelch repeat-containing protein [Candidatus Eisenbacteria bacterium]
TVAIHATLLRGPQDQWQVTWWSGFDGLDLHLWTYHPGPFDPVGSFTRTTAPTPDNFYESGFVPGPDGRLLSVGGLGIRHNDGTPRAALFDPASGLAEKAAPLAIERYEPAANVLPDGRVLVSGGFRCVYALAFGGRAPVAGDPGAVEARGDFERLAAHVSPVWRDSAMDAWGSAQRPPPGEGQSALYDPAGANRMLVFGGHDPTAPDGRDRVFDRVWQLERYDRDDAHEVVWTWDTLKTAADPVAGRPAGRYAHAAVLTAGRQMIVFGGRDSSGAFGDVWQLDVTPAAPAAAPWTRLSPAPDPVNGVPSPRWGAAAVYDPAANRMLVFGGRDAAGLAADDAWALSLGASPAWTRLSASGAPREGHTAVLAPAGDRVWVFGGRGPAGVRADLREYRLDTAAWRTPALAPGPQAPARADHAAAVDENNQMLVSGGERADGSLDGHVWRLPFVSPSVEASQLAWTMEADSTSGPGPRAGHSLCYETDVVFARRFEVYDPRLSTGGLPGATTELPASADHFAYFYRSLFVLPSGHVFYGVDVPTAILDLTLATWTNVPGGAPGGTAGEVVQYRPGQIMRCGGNFKPGLTEVVSFGPNDETSGWSTWTLGQLLPRILHRATLLPTGDVLVSGGVADISDTLGRRVPQIWSPGSGWTDSTLLDPEPVVRNYHQTAVLLPDGRVMTGGGAFTAIAPFEGCVYEPPYLFDAGDQLVRQTVLTGLPTQGDYGQTVLASAAVPADLDSITGVCLVKPVADTHDVNFEQRYVPLAFTRDASGLEITLPASANLAPPGDYMLFALRQASGQTVPGIASWMRLLLPGTALGVGGAPPAPALALAPPEPNPARGALRVRFTLPAGGAVELAAFDVGGRRVATLARGVLPAGPHAAMWNARDAAGRPLRAGLYFLRLDAGGANRVRRVAITP